MIPAPLAPPTKAKTLSKTSPTLAILRWATVLVAAQGTVTTISAVADEVAELEAAGDASAEKARKSYADAFRLYRRYGDKARECEDSAALSRSLAAQTSLSALLLSPTEFPNPVGLKARKDAGRALLLVKSLSASNLRQLNTLEKTLAYATRSAQLESRDSLLRLEIRALLQQLIGDSDQIRADVAYRNALAAACEKPNATSTVVDRVRLSQKLRDFAGALALNETIADIAGLPREAQVTHLRVLLRVAVFYGDRERVKGISTQLRKLTGVAEEQKLGFARWPSLLGGARVNLDKIARCLRTVVRDNELPLRENALVSYLLGTAALDAGDYVVAAETLREIYAYDLDDPWLEASIASRLGQTWSRLGDYEASLYALRQARGRLGAMNVVGAFRSRVGLDLARAHLGLGQPASAREEVTRVLSMNETSAELRLRGLLLLANIVYEEARQTPEKIAGAQAAFEAVGAEIEKSSNSKTSDNAALRSTIAINTANCMRLQALAFDTQGRSTDGRKFRKAAVKRQLNAMVLATSLDDARLEAIATSNLGELHLELGDTRQAEALVKRAQTLAERGNYFETAWRCHWYRGRIADATGKRDFADACYERAAALLAESRSRLLGDDARHGFFSSKETFYQHIIARELKHQRPRRALEFVERAHGQALLGSLGWRFLARSSANASRDYREFMRNVALLQAEHPRRRSVSTGIGFQPLDYDAVRDSLEKTRRTILDSTEVGPLAHVLVSGSPFSLAGLQRELGSNTELVRYTSSEGKLLVFVVRSDSVDSVTLRVDIEALSETVSQFVRTRCNDPSIARRLYDVLLTPIDDLLTSEKLLIVPNEPIQGLPFEALRTEDGYVLEEREVSYLPSAGLLEYLSRVRPAAESEGPENEGKPVLSVIDRAEGSSPVIANFTSRLREAEVVFARELSRADLQRSVRGRDVVHLSLEDPSASPVEFDVDAQVPGADVQPLSTLDVNDWDLRQTRLVSLSFPTGKNSETESQTRGKVRFTVTLLHAGAHSVLLDLWRPPDEARGRLLQSFYARWLDERKSRASALRQAKLSLLSKASSRDPEHWAAFVLMGEWRQ